MWDFFCTFVQALCKKDECESKVVDLNGLYLPCRHECGDVLLVWR